MQNKKKYGQYELEIFQDKVKDVIEKMESAHRVFCVGECSECGRPSLLEKSEDAKCIFCCYGLPRD